MSILNRPSDGLLSVLLALHRGVLAYGPQSEAALLDLVAPSTVVPDGKPDMARKSLTRWTQLGFFSSDDGIVTLSPAIATVAPNDADRLRAVVLRLVLAPENNPAFSLAGDDDQEGSKASDATRALAWVLAQDPYTFPSGHKNVEQLQSSQGVEPTPFVNDTRWFGFSDGQRSSEQRSPVESLGWSLILHSPYGLRLTKYLGPLTNWPKQSSSRVLQTHFPS